MIFPDLASCHYLPIADRSPSGILSPLISTSGAGAVAAPLSPGGISLLGPNLRVARTAFQRQLAAVLNWMFEVFWSQTAACSSSVLLMHRLRSGKHSVVFRRKVFDEDLVLFRRELRPAAADAGIFASEVIGESVSVPMREFVVRPSGRKSQDKAIVLERDLQGPEVLIGVFANIRAERFGGSGTLQRRQHGIVCRCILTLRDHLCEDLTYERKILALWLAIMYHVKEVQAD